jgi:hypothetical protein
MTRYSRPQKLPVVASAGRRGPGRRTARPVKLIKGMRRSDPRSGASLAGSLAEQLEEAGANGSSRLTPLRVLQGSLPTTHS